LDLVQVKNNRLLQDASPEEAAIKNKSEKQVCPRCGREHLKYKKQSKTFMEMS